jgi:hypothetical protein
MFKGTVSRDDFFCSKGRLHSRSGSSLYAQFNWDPGLSSNVYVKMLCEKTYIFLKYRQYFLGCYFGPSALMEASCLTRDDIRCTLYSVQFIQNCQNNFFPSNLVTILPLFDPELLILENVADFRHNLQKKK